MKSNNVPCLRFPEFRDAPEWDVIPLGVLACLITKGTTPTSLGFQFIETGINFIKIESITEYGSIDLTKVAYISEECDNALKRSQLKENDILFSIAGALGVVAIVKNDVLPANINQALAIVRLKNQDSLAFISNYLKTQIIQSEIERIRAGAAQPNISLGQLGNFLISLPTLLEQQKIADCLTSLDDLIAAQSTKAEALKKQKKALMQQLFPREGENVPRLRFSEFRDAPEWEEKRLDEIIEDFIVPMRDKPKELNGDIPWCRIEDFDGMYLSKSKTNQGVTKETVKNMNLKVYPVNTLLVSCSADLGRCAITSNELVTNQTFIGLVPKKNETNNVFLYYVMINAKQRLNALSSGTTIAYLSRQEFEKFQIKVPKPDEQQKIADCLTSLDDLIIAQSAKVETLKAHKKGLMQQLFPSSDKVEA